MEECLENDDTVNCLPGEAEDACDAGDGCDYLHYLDCWQSRQMCNVKVRTNDIIEVYFQDMFPKGIPEEQRAELNHYEDIWRYTQSIQNLPHCGVRQMVGYALPIASLSRASAW